MNAGFRLSVGRFITLLETGNTATLIYFNQDEATEAEAIGANGGRLSNPVGFQVVVPGLPNQRLRAPGPLDHARVMACLTIGGTYVDITAGSLSIPGDADTAQTFYLKLKTLNWGEDGMYDIPHEAFSLRLSASGPAHWTA